VLTLRRLGLCALSGLLGAAAFPLAFPFTDGEEILSSGVLEPLAFVCLVPALIATRGLVGKKVFATGFLAGMAFFAGAFWWVNVAMTTFGGMPNYLSIPALLLLVAWCAVHWGLAFYVTRYLERAHGWPVAFTFAPVWMATELMRNYFCSGFPWANLGYSQMRNLWLSQVGALGGVYGVALLVAFVNAALYEAWRWRFARERELPRRLLLGAAGALVGGHLYGAIRVAILDSRIEAAPKVKVAVIQGNIDQKLKNTQSSHAQMVLGAYNPPTAAADAAGADLIVWPEASYPLAFPVANRDMRRKGLAKPAYRAWMVLGVDRYDPLTPREGENSAYVVEPDLDVSSVYTKYHLVPFGEYVLFDLDKYLPIDNLVPGTFRAGTSLDPLPFSVPSLSDRQARMGIQICYDAIFPEISRAYARGGADLLVNLTNDAWYGLSSAPHQFLRMVAMRAVETGRPVARAANTGISAFIDPLGRIQHATPLGIVKSDHDRVDASLKLPSEWRMADLPLLSGRTPYVVLGDLPAYLAALFALSGLGWGMIKNRKARRATRQTGAGR
jgi:apolipoprotein N-acyltransferase